MKLFLNPHTVYIMGTNDYQNFYFKSNGRIGNYKKKIHGKEVPHERVKPLSRLFGQGGGVGLFKFYIGCLGSWST